jgi:hypothetical protein
MAEVKINSVKLELTTVKLTKALFKQLVVLNYGDFHHLLNEQGEFQDGVAVGWVHGSVTGDEYRKWLILQTAPGQYGRYDAMNDTIAKTGAKQIYLV